MRAPLLAIFIAFLLALPAVALASTPTDDVYSHADDRDSADVTQVDAGSGGGGAGGASASGGGLAFTGLDVGLVALAGVAILGTGIAIRRAARTD